MTLLFGKRKNKAWRRPKTFARHRSYFQCRKNSAVKNLKNIIIIGLVFFAVYFVFFSEFLSIKEIIVEGNKNIASDRVENIAKSKITEPILGFIPGNNFFFDKNEKIKTALIGGFAEIKSVEITRSFPNIMKIKIGEREPTLVWCRLDSCYYLDSKGIAFLSADQELKINPGKKIVKVIEQLEIKEELEDIEKSEELKVTGNKDGQNKESESGNQKDGKPDNSENDQKETGKSLIPIKLDSKVSDEDFVSFALKVNEEIEHNITLKVKYYKTKGTATRELIAYTDENIRLYFDMTKDAGLQVKYLSDFLSKGIDKEKISALKYIYLKAGDKIYYK